jgi:PTH1 family peptidyl-tRNA hydrolase
MAEQAVELLVGLGNPGPEYASTRHNAGCWLVDRVARLHGSPLRRESKFNADCGRIRIAGRELWLLEPLTFMNRSGQAVVAFASYYRIAPPAILVVHDDLDLPPGGVRLKRAGGHGGHNGLRDLIRQLGADNFLRLRLGIGHPGSSAEVLNYVLGRARTEDQVLIDQAIDDAVRELPLVVSGQIEKAMHALHSRRVAPAIAPEASRFETKRED